MTHFNTSKVRCYTTLKIYNVDQQRPVVMKHSHLASCRVSRNITSLDEDFFFLTEQHDVYLGHSALSFGMRTSLGAFAHDVH